MKKHSGDTRTRTAMITSSVLNLLFSFITFRAFEIALFRPLVATWLKALSAGGETTGPVSLFVLLVVEVLLAVHLYTLYRYRALYTGPWKILLIVDLIITPIVMFRLLGAYAFTHMFDDGFNL